LDIPKKVSLVGELASQILKRNMSKIKVTSWPNGSAGFLARAEFADWMAERRGPTKQEAEELAIEAVEILAGLRPDQLERASTIPSPPLNEFPPEPDYSI
jgi:hypothetical protein